jgi:hypothetical protein
LWNRAKEICPKVALENPMNVLGAMIGKRTQAIQPYQFGHMEQKETWLWLHGLQPLKPTKHVYYQMMKLPRKQRERLHYLSPGPNRGKERSRTFTGIADAMSRQWSN